MSTPTTLELPAEVRATTVSTDRGDFAVHDARPSAGAERGHLLLVPGFTGSKEDFTPVLPLLARAGWHATAYDQRGQYQTPGGPGDDYSLRGFAADAFAVRAAAAPGTARSHLVGHSFGGLVAQHALVAEPACWASLTLLCTGPAGFDRPAQIRPLEAFIAAVPESGVAAVFEVMQSRKPQVPPDIGGFLRARFTANSPVALVEVARRLLDAPDRVDDVVGTGVPTFVVRGRDDSEWAPAVQAAMAARLGVDVTVVADSAHSPAVENPAATVGALLAGPLAS